MRSLRKIRVNLYRRTRRKRENKRNEKDKSKEKNRRKKEGKKCAAGVADNTIEQAELPLEID